MAAHEGSTVPLIQEAVAALAIDEGAAAAARTFGNRERQEASVDLGTPDAVSTPLVDEHVALTAAAGRAEELADVAIARAAALCSPGCPPGPPRARSSPAARV